LAWGIPKDTEAGRAQLEQCLETRRAREDGTDLKAIRRGWCLGGDAFRQDLLDSVHTRVTESHPAQTRRETAEDGARRILNEELDKLGWTGAELAQRAKGDEQQAADRATAADGDGGDVEMDCGGVADGHVDTRCQPPAPSEG
jgi:hypothetical protein